MNNKKVFISFANKVEEKFKKYLVAYALMNKNINIIIDDRDILKMDKRDLLNKISNMLSNFSKDNIKFKVFLVSDLNETNIWDVLGDEAKIFNVKALISFIGLKITKEFFEVYKSLPPKFKLSDFKREIERIAKKEFHRNTYQNWLKSLESANFVRLKNRTYYKIQEPYKKELLENL